MRLQVLLVISSIKLYHATKWKKIIYHLWNSLLLYEWKPKSSSIWSDILPLMIVEWLSSWLTTPLLHHLPPASALLPHPIWPLYELSYTSMAGIGYLLVGGWGNHVADLCIHPTHLWNLPPHGCWDALINVALRLEGQQRGKSMGLVG